MNKTIHTASGHTMFVESVSREELPANAAHAENYTTFYRVRNWDKDGAVFFYVAKGCAAAPGQYVVWFRSGKFWSSFGTTLKSAIEGAQADGWMYA
jgi:hypothetical protein